MGILKSFKAVGKRSFASLPGKVENAWNTSDVFDHHEEGLHNVISGNVDGIKDTIFGKEGILQKGFSSGYAKIKDHELIAKGSEWFVDADKTGTFGNAFEEFHISENVEALGGKIEDLLPGGLGEIGGNFAKIIASGGNLSADMIGNFSEYQFSMPNLNPITSGMPSFKDFSVAGFSPSTLKSLDSPLSNPGKIEDDPGSIGGFISDITGKDPSDEAKKAKEVGDIESEQEKTMSEITSDMDNITVTGDLTFGDIKLDGLDGLEGLDIMSNDELINGVNGTKLPDIHDPKSIFDAGGFEYEDIYGMDSEVEDRIDAAANSFDFESFDASQLSTFDKLSYNDNVLSKDVLAGGVKGLYPLPEDLANPDIGANLDLGVLGKMMSASELGNAYKLPLNEGGAMGQFAEDYINSYTVSIFGFPISINMLAMLKEILPTTGQFKTEHNHGKGHKINTRITHQKTSDPFNSYLDWNKVHVDTNIELPEHPVGSKERFASTDKIASSYVLGKDVGEYIGDLLKKI